MKRSVLLLAAVAVAATPFTAEAAPGKKPRTLTYEYSGAQAGGHTAIGSFSTENGCQAVEACWDFSTVKGEKTIEITATDASGADVGFQVFYDDAYADNVVLFCGKGKISVSPKVAHLVSVRMSLHDCEGVASEGTLKAVLQHAK
jgi:hypothetical protein